MARAVADPVDIHVGARLRLRRRALALSQESLGEKLGITFQQVQKYERGANRISASMMWRAANALQVAPAFFFDGLRLSGIGSEDYNHSDVTDALRAIAAVPEVGLIAELSRDDQRVLARVIRGLAKQD